MSSESSDKATGPARDDAGCAAICRRLGEPLIGTAPAAAAGWLLIEHPGPWPAYGLPPDLPAPIARFAREAAIHAVRTQLIRRPDRTGRQVGVPTVMLAGGPPGGRWLERGAPADLGALARLDPAGIARSGPPGFGVPVEAALLVCTHGRREVCCARFGGPVARALAARFGSLVWETTHVGGDRFAANLVVLPSGAYYGRLDPEDAVRVAQAAMEGRMTLDRFRGTAGLPEAAQAAECLLRSTLGTVDAGAVRYVNDCDDSDDGAGRLLGTDEKPDRQQCVHVHGQPGTQSAAAPYRIHRVRFAVSDMGAHTVTLARCQEACPRLTSCGTGSVEAPIGYRLLGISGPLADPLPLRVPGFRPQPFRPGPDPVSAGPGSGALARGLTSAG